MSLVTATIHEIPRRWADETGWHNKTTRLVVGGVVGQRDHAYNVGYNVSLEELPLIEGHPLRPDWNYDALVPKWMLDKAVAKHQEELVRYEESKRLCLIPSWY